MTQPPSSERAQLSDADIERIRQQPEHHRGEFDHSFDELSFARAVIATDRAAGPVSVAEPVRVTLGEIWDILMDQSQPHLGVRIKYALKAIDRALATQPAADNAPQAPSASVPADLTYAAAQQIVSRAKLRKDACYIRPYPAEGMVVVDGKFTPEELDAMAFMLRAKKG